MDMGKRRIDVKKPFSLTDEIAAFLEEEFKKRKPKTLEEAQKIADEVRDY